MAEFQILLLPRQDYWEWVRASQGYVLAFGPNLTSDPATAGRYMAPRQVISFPDFPGAYAESQDMVAWYQKRYPGIRVDAISAATPGKLQRQFEKRIEAKDRYGQRLRPFFLLWATDYPVVTQPFGVNPQIYHRFGLPGHEGVDMRALTNTNIYSAFDGVVYEVFRDAKHHAYGIHIRVRHRDGFKTVYAHLAKPLVGVGEEVKGGQLIGKADSTGASTGSHLHLTLKQDGATARGETRYPKDIIDPTPYLVWPDGYRLKQVEAKGWPAERCLVGAVGRVDGLLRPVDLDLVARARLEALSLSLAEPEETVRALRRVNPGIQLIISIPSPEGGDGLQVADSLSRCMGDIGRLLREGVRDFELGSVPNLQSGGWNRAWRDGGELAAWWLETARAIRAEQPDVRLGFPGLDPGDHLEGWRAAALPFLEEASAAAEQADWIGVHAYWDSRESMLAVSGGRWYEQVIDRFPGQRLLITAFANPSEDVPAQVKAREYLEFLEIVGDEPVIGAALCSCLSARKGFDSVVWRTESGEDREIAGPIGDRPRNRGGPSSA
ncbi:MAG: M23 family metallopeptidase [Anaerolineales bacterium]|nr:M23 family metallopeptidase [Anaerolineales bacterium]